MSDPLYEFFGDVPVDSLVTKHDVEVLVTWLRSNQEKLQAALDFDPDLCEECQDRPAMEEGTYAGLCDQCGFAAFKEDKADRERDERY